MIGAGRAVACQACDAVEDAGAGGAGSTAGRYRRGGRHVDEQAVGACRPAGATQGGRGPVAEVGRRAVADPHDEVLAVERDLDGHDVGRSVIAHGHEVGALAVLGEALVRAAMSTATLMPATP